MLKEEIFHNPGDGLYVSTFKPNLHIEKITSREGFIALIVTDRIVNASAQAGVLPRQGSLPGITHLWSLLYRNIDIIIKDLNSRIAGGAGIETLLRRLVDLLSIDVSFSPSGGAARAAGRQPTVLIGFFLLAIRHGSGLEISCRGFRSLGEAPWRRAKSSWRQSCART